jgi:FecR protein
MNAPNANSELLLRHLDGNLDTAEKARVTELLRTDAGARAFLREVAEQAVIIGELGRTESARHGELHRRAIPPDDSHSVRARLHDRRWIPAVAAAVMLLAGGAYWWMSNDAEMARITEASGALQWTGDGGQVIRDLTIGSVVSGGTIESLSAESWVAFKFRDGSQVTIPGRSVVTISAQRQKVLHLRDGSLSAKVAPQPEGRPMLVHTQVADLAVLGTQFNVKADSAYTVLSVNEGRVRVTRLVDGKVVEVPARHRVVASINSSSELMPNRPPDPVNQWRSKLPADALYGKSLSGGGLRSEPLFLKETPHGPLLLHVTAISVSSGDSPPVLLGADARFRIRGRLASASDVVFGITTHFQNGGCAGKYSASRRVEATGGGAARQFELELRLSELRPEDARSPRSAAGLTIEDCWCLTVHADKGLEIMEVELVPN